MHLTRKNRSAALAALALLALIPGASATADQVLYQTGFEAPDFTPGVLAGQDGFIAYQDNSIGAATIIGGFARAGSQSARIDGSQLNINVFENQYEGYYYPVFDYDPLASGTPVLDIGWDMLFTPAGDLPGYAGVHAYDPLGDAYAGMSIHADGLLRYGGAGGGAVPVAFNEWHRLGMRLDFTARSTEFFLNGVPLGTFGFSSETATRFGDADLYMETGSSSAPHLAYFDDYAITAVPEPGSIAVIAAGLLPLVGAVRRRRRHASPPRTTTNRLESFHGDGRLRLDLGREA